ncbi:MAG: transporter substrate-binding domain-containing protein [Muribaculaceae bacterium]|nr:transporter substrate-binding domain-containing protein [Muribaculaceae bacterium]
MKPRATATIVIIVALLNVFNGCKGNSDATTGELRHLPDTLRVATLYSPLSYFIYRDDEMGYDYSLIKSFADDKGMVLDIVVAPGMERMIAMVDSGLVDVAAYEIPVTAEYKKRVLACGPENYTSQVLVQPKKKGKPLIKDVTDLVGKDVWVERNSKYQYRLENLNEELGGGINIHTVDKDTLITEDLIEMVSKGTIPLTIVDSDIARINQTYYKGLDTKLELSFKQRQAWAVAPGNKWLADSIDAWLETEKSQKRNEQLLKRYFELSKTDDNPYPISFEGGKISAYDAIFKKYAKEIGWDWRLIAAQGFTESHFNPDAVSWVGARGIMQIMPSTATAYGLESSRIAEPEPNIATSVKIIKSLEKTFIEKVPDPEERKKFVIAAYNSGPAHILDAISIAKEMGKNPGVWDGNVAEALLMKSNPKYFNDKSICKYGYFRGKQTYSYVKEVYKFYNKAKESIGA